MEGDRPRADHIGMPIRSLPGPTRSGPNPERAGDPRSVAFRARARRALGVGLLALALAGCATPPAKPARLTFWSDRYDRAELGTFARHLVQLRRYDRLDSLADSLQRCDCRFDDGASRLAAYEFFGMRTVSDPRDPARWEEQLAHLREWAEARPQSVHAPVALAEALIGRGWAARGGGWARDVSDRGWRGFGEDLREARQILDHCAAVSKATPSWYEAMLDVMQALGTDRATYDSTYAEAVARFPAYDRFYIDRSWYLLPRWYGEPGEWERAAAECAPALPDSLRDELYARIVVFQSAYEKDLFRASPGLDWDRTRRGLETWQRHYPSSPEPTSALALFAYQTGRLDVARGAFRHLGNNVHVDVWPVTADYVQARQKLLGS